MARRPVDSVQISGWTSDTAVRAVRLLTVGPCADPDEVALAHELLRWLRCAVDGSAEGAEQLTEYLDKIRPSGANVNPWDQLLDSLSEEPLSEVVVRLRAERPDLAGELCALLDEIAEDEERRLFDSLDPDDQRDHVAEDEGQFDSLDRDSQRAVQALIMLGTAEGLRYLLTHIGLLCWEDGEALTRLIQPHREALGQAAVDVWDALGWRKRAVLVLTFAEYDLPSRPLVERLLAVDGEALDYQDRTSYVHALSFIAPPAAPATARIQHLLNRALEAPAQLGEEGRRFVAETIYHLPARLTADQRRRAGEAGVNVDAVDSDWPDAESPDAGH